MPGGTLMSHGNSDVMEAEPRFDLSVCVCVCVCVCVLENKKAKEVDGIRLPATDERWKQETVELLCVSVCVCHR